MRVSLLFCRRMLLGCAVLFVAVAVALALGVSWSVFNGLPLLAAITLVFIAIGSKGKSWISTSVLVVLGLAGLLHGIALVVATPFVAGFLSEVHGGPSTQAVSILLFVCAAADCLAGVLVVATAFLRPKKA